MCVGLHLSLMYYCRFAVVCRFGWLLIMVGTSVTLVSLVVVVGGLLLSLLDVVIAGGMKFGNIHLDARLSIITQLSNDIVRNQKT